MLDYSQYLQSADLESIDAQVQQAYEKWSSYCYMAYSPSSGSLSDTMSQSHSASSLGSASCTSCSFGSEATENPPVEALVFGGKQEYTYNESYSIKSADYTSGIPIPYSHPSANCSVQKDSNVVGNKQTTCDLRSSEQGVPSRCRCENPAYLECDDNDNIRQDVDYVNFDDDINEHVNFQVGSQCACITEGFGWDSGGSDSDPEETVFQERDDNMPRPPGCGFGSRLSWVHGQGRSRVEGRISPVLGVSGLIYSRPCDPSTKKREDSFPKCVTNSFASQAGNGYHTIETYQALHHCKTIRTNLDITIEQTESVNLTKTKLKTAESRTNVILSADVIDDIIDEVSSEEEEEEEQTKIQFRGKGINTRRVSFADENGEELVICHIFQKEESIADSLSSVSECDNDWSDDDDVFLDDGDDDDEDYDDDYDDDDNEIESAQTIKTLSKERKERIGLIAASAYKKLNEDMERVKYILKQHRDYFENLDPQNGPQKPNDEQCVDSNENILLKTINSTNGDFSEQDMNDRGICETTDTGDGSECDSDTKNNELTIPDLKFSSFNFQIMEHDKVQMDLRDSFVELDKSSLHLSNQTNTIHGVIRVVHEITPDQLFIRYTADEWDSYQDISAHMTCDCGEQGNTKRFPFWIPIPEKAFIMTSLPDDIIASPGKTGLSHDTDDDSGSCDPATGVCVEFALCVISGNSKLWDNNNDKNYSIHLLPD